MKTDARVRYTKKVLRESLLRCLEEKPIQKVTVREVCERAELNRATFYKHYRDCYELLEQIENELLDEFRASLVRPDLFDVTRLVGSIFDVIDKNADFYRLLTEQRRDDLFLRKMITLAHDSTIGVWREHLPKATEEELELLFVCMANGLFHVVTEHYPRLPRETLIRFADRTLKSCMEPYL